MNNPLITIIIPVYNGADYLVSAIDSAINQSYKNIEIIVVNDGSTDNGATDKIAKSYGDKIVYISKENGGVATALNCGIQAMKGEYFSWLSHDDYYLPDKLKNQVEVLESLDKDTVLYTNYYLEDVDKKTVSKVDLSTIFKAKYLDTPLFPVFKGIANGCTMLIPKTCFDEIGCFNVDLKTTQDYDMWFRMFRKCKIHYCSFCDVVMRQHKSQGSKTIKSHDSDAENLWISMGQEIKEYEMVQIYGTPYNFYKEVYTNLKENTNLTGAINFYKDCMEKEFVKMHTEKTSENDILINTLIENLNEAIGLLEDNNIYIYKIHRSKLKIVCDSIKTDGFFATIYKCIKFLKKDW